MGGALMRPIVGSIQNEADKGVQQNTLLGITQNTW